MSNHAPEGWVVETDLIESANLAVLRVTDPAGRTASDWVMLPDAPLTDTQQAAAPWRKAGPVTPNHVYRSVEQFERCLAEANQPAAPTATAGAPTDGLEAWERDALQRFENSHEPAFLDPIVERGSAAARAKAAAALADRQVVAA